MSDIPKAIREEVQAELWRQADELVWDALPNGDKTTHYENWTSSAAIGGKLAQYLDPRTVRVYIKDTLLKAYTRAKLREHEATVLRVIGASAGEIVEHFIKPHGAALGGSRIVHWGRADDWKSIVTTSFERTRAAAAKSSVIVFFRAGPRFSSGGERAIVADAAQRLGATRCVWFD